MSLSTIILAAGMGKRMNDPTKPKVLFEIHGKPMLEYVINRAIEIGSDRIVVVVGFQRDQVISFVQDRFPHVPNIAFAVQEEQLGTGHAVAQAREALADFSGDVVILSGDVPLLTVVTLRDFQDFHRDSGHTASLISCKIDNPFGYGRIVRDDANVFCSIREEKDASEAERAIGEINSGIYMVRSRELFDTLARIGNDNAGGEYYLTDIFQILAQEGSPIGAYAIADPLEIAGANTVEQLRELEHASLDRVAVA